MIQSTVLVLVSEAVLLTVCLYDGMTYSSALTQTHQTVVIAVDFWSALMKSSRHSNDSHVASVHAELSDKNGDVKLPA